MSIFKMAIHIFSELLHSGKNIIRHTYRLFPAKQLLVRLSQFLILVFLTCIISCEVQNTKELYFGAYSELPVTEIIPQGWLKELLNRQRNGLGLHHDESGYPYNTCLWAGKIPKGGNPIAKEWWPYEQTGYLVDGLYRCGLLLNDTSLIHLGEKNVRYVLDHPRTDGRLGTEGMGEKQWPFTVFARAMMADYAVTGNPEILSALTTHFLNLPKEITGRDVCIIESMCWTYGQTHNPMLIKMAEQIWKGFSERLNPDYKESQVFQQVSMMSADSFSIHGVTTAEIGKQPAILYLYTGKEEYKKEALGFFNSAIKYHELVDGIPSSCEKLVGKQPEGLHETCDISDFTWSYGYLLMATGEPQWGDQIERAILNAGLGAISKDFKSHQYFSSPNQIFATHMSSNASYGNEGRIRQAFRPGFDVECCSGNVHRMIPNYASRLWLKDNRGGLVAALYAPNTLNTKIGGGKLSLQINEETDYPFSGKINFKITVSEPCKFPLSFRIPHWAKGASVKLNNEQSVPVENGKFFVLERVFKSGDQISIELPMDIRVVSPVEDGISLVRGPLVFSLLIDEKAIKVTDQLKTSNEFPAWDISPASPWNYTLDLGEVPGEGNVSQEIKPMNGFPWLPENTPVSLFVNAKRIPGWKGEYTTPGLPAPGFKYLANEEKVKLIPLGATRIRLSIFPKN